MSSIQRPKRKAASQMTFNDDNAVPVKKKSKVESDNAHHIHGKINGATSKKSKVYEEQVDGFTFSRSTRSKNAQPKSESELNTTKMARRAKLDNAVEPEYTVPNRRRSKRLSAEKEQGEQPIQTTRSRTETQKIRTNHTTDKSPSPQKDAIHVTKKRDITQIALPFADTPVMSRNKEMRAAQRRLSGRRRSSAGIRGRRASSLIESGQSNAVPHADVEVSDFYKLIGDDLLEQKRMRQLLVWCAARSLIEKPRPGHNLSNMETMAVESARQLQDELLKDFASKPAFSDWWSRTEDPVSDIPKKPNPRNIKNSAKLKELEDEIKRLETEEHTWKRLLSNPKPATTPTLVPTPTPIPSSTEYPDIDSSFLSESQCSLLSLISPSGPQSTAQLSTRIHTLAASLEPTVDALADGIHTLSQYSLAANRVASRITGVWAGRLQAREEQAVRNAGSEMGTRDILRALAGSLGDR